FSDDQTDDSVTGWMSLNGTGMSAACIAALINVASTSHGSFAQSTHEELFRIYHHGDSQDGGMRDIVLGSYGGYSALPGWDFLTGYGSPISVQFDAPVLSTVSMEFRVNLSAINASAFSNNLL